MRANKYVTLRRKKRFTMAQTRENRIQTVTLWGGIVNLILSVLKLVAGIIGCSSAMIADAIHSFSDLISDAVVLVMVHIAGHGPDKSHDSGHGKFETLATLIVAGLLFAVGIRLMTEGVEKIRFIVCGGEVAKPGLIALIAAFISIVTKEGLYRWTHIVGKQVKSQVMEANAWHHRSDALSSVGSFLGIGGAMLLGGKWVMLDPLICCVISLLIIVMSVKMLIPAAKELTEASLSDEEEDVIVGIVRGVNDVEDVHELKTRRSGPYIIISLHLVVDEKMTVLQAHDITVEVENRLRQALGQDTQITIHVEPNKEAK